jgi:hypothetical protein
METIENISVLVLLMLLGCGITVSIIVWLLYFFEMNDD